MSSELDSENLAQCLKLASEIMSLCHSHKDLQVYATEKLKEISDRFEHNDESDSGIGGKSRAQKDIEDHISILRKSQNPIKPTSVVYRDIASLLSKNKDIPFDPKATKKKRDLFRWFDEHWPQIKDSFFILLDQHPLVQNAK